MAKLGRPRKYEGTETRITIRVDEETRKDMRHIAAVEDSNMTEIANKSVRHYINRWKAAKGRSSK